MTDDELYLECFLLSGTYGDLSADRPHKTVMVFRSSINGTPSVYQVIHSDPQNGHAEFIFLNLVKISPEATEIKIEMFISYSPCDICAKALIHWIKNLRDQGKTVSIAIKFSTLNLNETHGLILLHQLHGITLGVFNRNVWGELFQLIDKNLDQFQELINQRAARETEDAKKLKGIISLKRI